MGKLSHIVKAIEVAKKRKLEAYHGTPHEVDKFDSSKIGAGKKLGKTTKNIQELEGELSSIDGVKSLSLFENSHGDIKLSTIIIDKDKRKQGIGSSVMDRINAFADEQGKRVVLTPAVQDDFQGTTSRRRLVDFYKGHGYKENKGRKKDFTVSEGMIRDPQQGIATTEGMAIAGTVGAAGLGLQAFIEKRKQRANSLVNRTIEKAQYYGEPAAALATGIGAGLFGDAVGGIAGLASLPFVGHERAAQITQGIQDSIPSYIPESEAGMQGLTDLVDTVTEEVGALYKDAVDYWGIDPIANFEQSAEALHEKGLNVPAAILKGAPHIL
jgi:hypothetical protein